jgi:hypothetical protein
VGELPGDNDGVALFKGELFVREGEQSLIAPVKALILYGE